MRVKIPPKKLNYEINAYIAQYSPLIWNLALYIQQFNFNLILLLLIDFCRHNFNHQNTIKEHWKIKLKI